jgi:hypothetical protein
MCSGQEGNLTATRKSEEVRGFIGATTCGEKSLVAGASCLGERKDAQLICSEEQVSLSPHGEKSLVAPSTSRGDANLDTPCSSIVEQPFEEVYKPDAMDKSHHIEERLAALKTDSSSTELPQVEGMMISAVKLGKPESVPQPSNAPDENAVRQQQQKMASEKQAEGARAGRKSMADVGGGTVSVFEDLVLRQERQRASAKEEEEDRDAEWNCVLHNQEKKYALFR